MKRGTATLIACTALLLAAGCGSSNKVTPAPRTSAASGTSGSAPAAGSEVFGEPGEKTQTTPLALTHPSGPVAQVFYRDVAISPARTRVKVGTTIVWTNEDAVEHNVTSVSGPAQIKSGNLDEGQSFEFVARRPGVIRYVCTIHPTTMRGEIAVVR
jgi:plastocyanin